MSSLIDMLSNDYFEVEEKNVEMNDDSVQNENQENENQVNEDNMFSDEIRIQSTNFLNWINEHENELQFVKKINIDSIDDLNENILILKNIECPKEIIQMYKNSHLYKILNLPCEYMKLYGENGFYILYNFNDDYKIKLYGTKSTVFITTCLNHNDILYPIHHHKTNKSKLEDEYSLGNLVTHEYFEELINNNSNFNFENCILLYPPIQKVEEPFENKQDVLNWLNNKNNNILDVPHAVKIDVTMWRILFMN